MPVALTFQRTVYRMKKFNLKFNKRDDSPKRKIMISRNDWTINGKVIDVKETEKGFWLKVKSKASIPGLYALDKLEFNCWLSRELSKTAYKKESYYHKLHAVGKFSFDNGEGYFVVQKMLV